MVFVVGVGLVFLCVLILYVLLCDNIFYCMCFLKFFLVVCEDLGEEVGVIIYFIYICFGLN